MAALWAKGSKYPVSLAVWSEGEEIGVPKGEEEGKPPLLFPLRD